MSKKKIGTNPRQIALLILVEYFKKGKSLKDIINTYFKDYKLSELNRRFIFNIVKGTVRYYLRIDFIISLFSDKNIKDIYFIIRNILRMGVYQLLYMDKVPDYSTVNESVKLAKKNATISSSRFVNAILRKISSVSNLSLFVEEKIKELLKDETEEISINYSYPRWLVKYWLDWYGKDETILICRSLNKNPHVYLRFDKNKITREEIIKKLDIESVKLSDRKVNSSCNKRSTDFSLDKNNKVESDNYKQFILKEFLIEDAIEASSVQNISDMDIYKDGLILVQDLSSQIAIKYFLEPRDGEKILDLCAAPGGKTAYIAELTKNNGEIISVDISRRRLKILEDNLERLNIKNVRIITADVTKADFLKKGRFIEQYNGFENKKIPDNFDEYFDKILIDAPCSAFGTISKNPDVKYNKTMDDIIRLSRMSYRMIVNCDQYLKKGGSLVFYTCTLSPIENQHVIGKFLKEFRGKYSIKKPPTPDWLMSVLNLNKDKTNPYKNTNQNKEYCLEIMPYYFESEAGFACRLNKNH